MLGCIITCSNSKGASSASATDDHDPERSISGCVNPPKYDNNCSNNSSRKSCNGGINSSARDHHITTRSIISNQLVIFAYGCSAFIRTLHSYVNNESLLSSSVVST